MRFYQMVCYMHLNSINLCLATIAFFFSRKDLEAVQ